MDVSEITAERGRVHGDFSNVAVIAQELKAVIRKGPSFGRLSQVQIEGLDMILHKIARIASGDPNHMDHWVDIAGYAKIVAERIKTK